MQDRRSRHLFALGQVGERLKKRVGIWLRRVAGFSVRVVRKHALAGAPPLSAGPAPGRAPKGGMLALLMLWPLGGLSAEQAEVRILHVESHVQSEAVFTEADFRVQLSDAQRQALNSGVPLTFLLEAELWHARRWWWDRQVDRLSKRYRLQYHALSRSYRLLDLQREVGPSFRHLDSALAALGRVEGLVFRPDPGDMDDKPLWGRLRVRLDVSALPLPLRLQGHASDDWTLSSDWYEWSIRD